MLLSIRTERFFKIETHTYILSKWRNEPSSLNNAAAHNAKLYAIVRSTRTVISFILIFINSGKSGSSLSHMSGRGCISSSRRFKPNMATPYAKG